MTTPTAPKPLSNAGAATAITRLRGAWQARNPREQRLIAIAALVLTVAGAVSLFDWSARERVRLQRLLPRAEAQLEATQEAATEIARLKGQTPPARSSAAALVDTVQASGKSRGLAVTVQSSGDGVQLKGQASFDELMNWLAALQHDQGLRLTRGEIQRDGDVARFDLNLAAPTAP